MMAFFKYFGTAVKNSCPRRARSNGCVERQNKDIIQQLRATINSQKEWCDLLPSIVFSINSSVNSATSYSPFELAMGMPSTVFSDILIPESQIIDSLPTTHQEALALLIHRHKAASTAMQHHYSKYNQQMKARYDGSSRDNQFKVGDIAYLSKPPYINSKSTDTKKLAAVRVGPYQVTQVKSPHTVKLRNLKTGKYIKHFINTDRLKKGFLRQDLTFSPVQTQELEGVL